ncbi:MAG: inositol monophosphatase family protein [Chloroflexia bacterium]
MTHSDHSLRSDSPNRDRVGQPTAATPYPDDAALANIEGAARKFIAEAGAIVLAGYTRGVPVEYKDKRRSDPVTEIDRAVESYLTGAVGERFPEQAVLGEEGQDPTGEHEYEWIVDPVDGTHNFGRPALWSRSGCCIGGGPSSGCCSSRR